MFHYQPRDQTKQSITPFNESNFFPLNKIQNQLSEPSASYKQWRVYKDKPPICTIPFPFCLQNEELNCTKNQKQNKNKQNVNTFRNLYRLKIANRVQEYDQPKLKNKVYTPYINYEKTPINQYLNYDLSDEINMGLKEVQIMASEIKKLRKQKFRGVDLDKPVKQKGIRVRKSYVKNWKGQYVS